MHIEDLQIWERTEPAPWVRESTSRWARLMLRAGLLYLDVFSASPLSRTETEILFLLFIEEGEKSEPAVLADLLHVSRQTMTGLLDRLEAGGFVTRRDHPTDRRRKVVRLSGKGLRIVRQVGARWLRRDTGFIASFPREKVHETLSLMERLCSKAEEWGRAHPMAVPGKPSVAEPRARTGRKGE